MYGTLDVFVQLRVVRDQPDSDLVPLGTKNAGLHQSVVSLAGTITPFSISSCTVFSASDSYLRGTRLAVVIFFRRRSLLDVYVHWGVHLHGFRAKLVTYCLLYTSPSPRD